MTQLSSGPMGYRIDLENRAHLEETGVEPVEAMKAFRDSFPRFELNNDPFAAVDCLNQGGQGACQGHALATIFAICFFLATGRRERFSRAAGYYLAQRFDGIRGDNGSTLSGGRKVATEHGMCLESDWPYPSQYDPREPSGARYSYKLATTKPFTRIDDLIAWIDLGLPVQTGLMWNATCERSVVDSYRAVPGSGGHSTAYWLRSAAGIWMPNSWGREWDRDGKNEWTIRSIETALATRNNTFIGYAPDGMSFPDQTPIS